MKLKIASLDSTLNFSIFVKRFIKLFKKKNKYIYTFTFLISLRFIEDVNK